jgi:hypothetical protein
MSVGQYQLVIKGEGKRMRYLLLDTASGFLHVANPRHSQPEWKPIITKSPPVKVHKG